MKKKSLETIFEKISNITIKILFSLESAETHFDIIASKIGAKKNFFKIKFKKYILQNI